jgi:hypothetical protein
MIDIKTIVNFEKIKPLAVAAICFLAVFVAGYGSGRMNRFAEPQTVKRSLSNTNYNTNTETQAKPADDSQNCPVKGSKSKTYHIAGGAFYARTNPDRCFNTESEAQAAGFVKSSR